MRKAILNCDRDLMRRINERLPIGVTGPPDEIDFDNPPQGVCVVEVQIKFYGEDLPEKFETKQGEQIKYITVDELRELGKTDATNP